MIRHGWELILNFHGLGTPHAGVDAGEAPFWLSTDRFKRVLDQVAEARVAGAPIRLSFDDGNFSDLDIAMPQLLQRGLSAEFFVLMGRVGQPAYLGAEDIRTLRASGMQIGLHGRNHLDWRRLDSIGLKDETVTARKELEKIIGAPVDTVSIPFGAYRRHIIAWLRRQGFTAIYTSDSGPASPMRRVRARTSLTGTIDTSGLDGILTESRPLLQRTRRDFSAFLRRNLI